MHAATPADTLQQRADYYERISRHGMTPLWEVLGALVPPQPRSPARAALWRPGDLIMTGTPEGVNAVAAGDTMRGTIAGLGEIEVTVVG